MAAAILAGGARPAAAQEDPVAPDGKGVVGVGLLGAEAVMITMGAVGVESVWPYPVFGGLGAVAGGIGGYFIETSGAPAEVPLYLLAGGMALVIPTLVVTLNATRYKPPESDLEEPIQNKPATEPPQPSATVKVTAQREAPPIALERGLVDVNVTRLALGVPTFQVRPLYTRDEVFRFGVAQGQELRFPVLRATF